MSTVLLQNTGGFELNDGWRISSVLVGIDYTWRGMVLPVQGFGQKPLSRGCVAFSRQKEVDRRTRAPKSRGSNVTGEVNLRPYLAID